MIVMGSEPAGPPLRTPVVGLTRALPQDVFLSREFSMLIAIESSKPGLGALLEFVDRSLVSVIPVGAFSFPIPVRAWSSATGTVTGGGAR